MILELNKAFENLHPLLKINFENIEDKKYKVEINLNDEKGKFRTGTSQEITYDKIEDSRFLNMAIGCANALRTIFSSIDISNLLDYFSPSELIVEFILNDKSLSTIEDFESRLNSFSARTNLLSKEYILKELQKLGIDSEKFTENEILALINIGNYELVFSTPSMLEFSNIMNLLVKNSNSWLFLVNLIKKWAKASNWSCNEAWSDGPLVEELLAYYTFIILSKQGMNVKKEEWWSNLSIMVDMCLDFSENDLIKAGFILD